MYDQMKMKILLFEFFFSLNDVMAKNYLLMKKKNYFYKSTIKVNWSSLLTDIFFLNLILFVFINN